MNDELRTYALDGMHHRLRQVRTGRKWLCASSSAKAVTLGWSMRLGGIGFS